VTAFTIKLHSTRYGRIEEHGPEVLLSDHATAFILQHMQVYRGQRVGEPGCGTGVISLCAAKAGARHVIGTDTDPQAVAAACYNRDANGLANAHFVRGSLLEPVAFGLDLVVALLPHKPAPRPFSRRYYGGWDGTDLLRATIRQGAEKLAMGGRLLLYLNSIANPRRISHELDAFYDVVTVAEKKRYFTEREFDEMTPGMFAHLEAQRKRGEADFWEDSQGLYFMARICEGRRR